MDIIKEYYRLLVLKIKASTAFIVKGLTWNRKHFTN